MNKNRNLIYTSGFKPRDTSATAVKRRKTLQKSKRYVTVKYKKQQDEQAEASLEKTMVAVKKLKSKFRTKKSQNCG